MANRLEIQNISWQYDYKPNYNKKPANKSTETRLILDEISLTVDSNALLCLVGPSGCGKSTLLRLISGLEKLQYGSIAIGGNIIADIKNNIHIPAEKRGVGMVFQHPSLFPHLSVADNIAFGIPKSEQKLKHKIVADMLNKISMEGMEKKYPHELSGGQQQRVALARALAAKPKILLLDEPYANLDDRLRRSIRGEMMSLLKASGVTTIMVTHDPEEALTMADEMLLLSKNGQILQKGTADYLHNQPINLEAARFFGHINIINADISQQHINTIFGELPIDEYQTHHSLSDLHKASQDPSKKIILATRPEGIRISAESDQEQYYHIENRKPIYGIIENICHSGAGWLINAELENGNKIIFNHIYGREPKIGEKVPLCLVPPHLFILIDE